MIRSLFSLAFLYCSCASTTARPAAASSRKSGCLSSTGAGLTMSVEATGFLHSLVADALPSALQRAPGALPEAALAVFAVQPCHLRQVVATDGRPDVVPAAVPLH